MWDLDILKTLGEKIKFTYIFIGFQIKFWTKMDGTMKGSNWKGYWSFGWNWDNTEALGGKI